MTTTITTTVLSQGYPMYADGMAACKREAQRTGGKGQADVHTHGDTMRVVLMGSRVEYGHNLWTVEIHSVPVGTMTVANFRKAVGLPKPICE